MRGIRGAAACGEHPTGATLACVRLLCSCLVSDPVCTFEGADGDEDEGEIGVGFVGHCCTCEVGEVVTGEFAWLCVVFDETCRIGELDSTIDAGLAGKLGRCSREANEVVSIVGRLCSFARMNGVMLSTGSGDVELEGVCK